MSEVLQERRILREAYTILRMLIFNLRAFLDTEDKKYLERAYSILCYASSDPRYVEKMHGFKDLQKNLESIYSEFKDKGLNLGEEDFSRLSEQVVYTIVRANIIATGINFRLKRMK
ncbi:MAG: hypothetical protein QW048_03565 [Nitrososphaerota archaeon]